MSLSGRGAVKMRNSTVRARAGGRRRSDGGVISGPGDEDSPEAAGASGELVCGRTVPRQETSGAQALRGPRETGDGAGRCHGTIWSSRFGEPVPGLVTLPVTAPPVSAVATWAGVAEGWPAR
jgi:hypothetical protein